MPIVSKKNKINKYIYILIVVQKSEQVIYSQQFLLNITSLKVTFL